MLKSLLSLPVLIGVAWHTAAAEQSLGTPVRSSEMRTFFPIADGDDRYIIADVQDYAERGYLLKTNLKTGKTEKLDNPASVIQDDSFGAMVTGDRHFFYSQGNVVLSCDLRDPAWKVWGRLDKETSYYFAFTEGPDGRIWCGGYPKTKLLSIDRQTGKVTDHGRLDPKEAYLTSLAFDDKNWLYGTIAQTRRGIVAFSPATGEKRQLLPDDLRKNGRLYVYAGKDGAVYAAVDGKTAKLCNGTLTWVSAPAPRKPDFYSTTYLAIRNKKFPDGTEVLQYDSTNCRIILRKPDGKLQTILLPAHSGGTKLSGKTLTADGKLFMASGHPMHLASADLKTGKLHDYGPIPYIAGGTFTIMRTAPDGKIYAGQYAGGGLWVFDPAKPWVHPGISKPLFGKNDPLELSLSFRSPQGTRCLQLSCPDVILFRGLGDQEKTFRVDKPGRYFINLQFLTTSAYGEVTLKVDGKVLAAVQTNSRTVGFTPVLSYPVDLDQGNHTFSISCTGKPAMAGLAGFEISQVEQAARFPGKIDSNPRNLGLWINETGQPRGLAVSPDNRKILLGGLAGYGLSGGKLINYDIPSGTAQVRDILDKGESVEELEWLDNGKVAIATTIRAQGGGYVIARNAAVKLYNPKTGKIEASRHFEGTRQIGSVIQWQGMLAAVGDLGRLYLLDPVTLELKREVKVYMASTVTITQTPMIIAPSGKLYIFAARGILELAAPDAEPRCIFRSPDRKITSGAACYGGNLYFIRSHELTSIPLPQ